MSQLPAPSAPPKWYGPHGPVALQARKSKERQRKASKVSTRACTHAQQSTLSTAQHSTEKQSTAQHSIAQHSTAQHRHTQPTTTGRGDSLPPRLPHPTAQHSTHPPHNHRGGGEASPGGPLPWGGGGATGTQDIYIYMYIHMPPPVRPGFALRTATKH